MSQPSGYHHISLSVTDVDRSGSWYSEVFGLDADPKTDGEGFQRIRLRSRDGGVTLTVTAHDDEVQEAFDERRPGLDHVAFVLANDEAVSALKKRFEQLGVEHSDVKTATNGAAMITLRDPDNIQLEVIGMPTA